MSKIGFAMLDGKDIPLVGIDYEMYGNDYGMYENIHNAKILARAEAEYLNGLLALQKRIRDTYEPELIDNVPIEGEPEEDDEGGAYRVYSQMREELVEKETDNLWYN